MSTTKSKPKVGDSFPIWFNRNGIVLKVFPYTGRYPQWFTWVVRITSDTPRGWLETVV